MKSRDKLHRRFLQTQDKKNWEAYKESRNNVKYKLKKAASNYLQFQACHLHRSPNYYYGNAKK